MATFLEIATPLARRGIPVIPVQPFSKKGVLKDQYLLATTDPAKIIQWNHLDPGFNVGCVCSWDSVAVLDCDVRGLRKRIEKETGCKFPPTFTVRSAGKRCGHFYFRQNEISRKLGFRKKAGLFDLQSGEHYVVGPGSRLDNGATYDIVDDSPIAEFPRWLAEWILANADFSKKHSRKDNRPVHEDFDFDDLMEFYGISGWQHGDWFIPDVCVIAGYQHEGSPLTGFFWNGESLGWHDFVTSCNGSDMGIGQVIKVLNAQKGEPYPGVIWEGPTVEETLELLTWMGAEEDVLPLECRYELIYSTKKHGRIYSNDGITWYTADGTRA
jgi:hypothetical protein